MWQDFLPLTLAWVPQLVCCKFPGNLWKILKIYLGKTLWEDKEENRKKLWKLGDEFISAQSGHKSKIGGKIYCIYWFNYFYLQVLKVYLTFMENTRGKKKPFFSPNHNPAVHFWVNKPNKTVLFNWYSPFIYQDNLLVDCLLGNLEHQVQSYKRGCLQPTEMVLNSFWSW